MSTEPTIACDSNTHRREALLRLSEALTAWSEPEAFAKTLAQELEEFLQFDFLDVLVLKQDSNEIEWQAWGRGSIPVDLSIEEMTAWHVFDSREPLHIEDWNIDRRFPRLREAVAELGMNLGSVVRLPLTMADRRLGTLGIGSRFVANYHPEDIGVLQLIARVVALAIDDGLNLRRAQTAQALLKSQNDRLQLLLNLTKRITSNLELREVLRAIAANVREVIQCDAVAILLPDMASEKARLYALDFPGSKGFVVEELIATMSDKAKQALETLTPTIETGDLENVRPELRDIVLAEGLKDRWLIPLVNHGRAIGLLAIMRTTEGSFTQEDVEFLNQASGQIAIAIENSMAYREILELKDKLAQEKLYLEEQIRSEMGFEQIIGNGLALKNVLELVNTVALTDSTVLLLGETGTGKELIARAIHEHSRRKDRTFVKLNCAAIPTGLLESELFGHEKGAFTGAISQKIGRLELADHGTLFLDEVGDIPIEIQPKLLRALQEREFERLGSTHTRKVNVRLIAATNRDLEKMVASREFRSDLYYRLHVFPIRIPPLRERKEDIPQLVSYFVQKSAKQMQKKIDSISPAVMKGLTAWEWPGNIRELENFIERAVIITRGKSLEAPLGELRKIIYEAPPPGSTQPSQQDVADIVKETINALNAKKNVMNDYAKKQREEIVRALTESNGRVGGEDGAAARIGTKRSTLISRMKRLGIDPRQYA